MIRLFNSPNNFKYPIFTPQEILNLQKVVNRNINRLQEYYYNRESFVKNNNILVRIIKFASIPKQLSHYELLNYIERVKVLIYREFDIISFLKNGSMNFIAVENYDDYFIIDNKNYRRVDILSILYSNAIEDGLALSHHTLFDNSEIIYGLDIKALLISYYYWRRDRERDNLSTNPAIFIYQIAVTNIIGEHFDYTLFKSILDRVIYGRDIYISIKNKNALSIATYIQYLNQYLEHMRESIENIRESQPLEAILNSIQLVDSVSAYTLLSRNYGYINRNNLTAIYGVEGTLLFDLLDLQGIKVALSRSSLLKLDIDIMKRDIFGHNITLNNSILKAKVDRLKSILRLY